MRSFVCRWNLFSLTGCLFVGSMGATLPVQAQNSEDSLTTISKKQVSLAVEDMDIRQALKQLFTDVGVNYVLDPTVRGRVTVSLKAVTFQTALESVLRYTSPPLTFRFENGIYAVFPSLPEPLEKPSQDTIKLGGFTSSATAIVAGLRKMPRFGANSGLDYQVHPEDNSIVLTTSDVAQFRAFRMAATLLDVKPARLSLRAEAIVLLTDAAGHKHKAVLSELERMLSDHAVQLNAHQNGMASKTHVALKSGSFDVRAEPVVNGDGTITLSAEGEVEFLWRVPGMTEPLRLYKKFQVADIAHSGDTVLLASTTMKSADDKASVLNAEVLFFLTPVLMEEKRTAAQPQTTSFHPQPGDVRP